MSYTSNLCSEIMVQRGEFSFHSRVYKLGEVLRSITGKEPILLKIIDINDISYQVKEPKRQTQIKMGDMNNITLEIISEENLQVEISPYSLCQLSEETLNYYINKHPAWFI